MPHPQSRKNVYFDSCVWIAFINKEKEYENVYGLIRKAQKGDIIIYTSMVSFVEVAKRDEIEEDRAKKLFYYDFVRVLQMDWLIASLARNFVRSGTQPLDAIHLASACEHKCDIIYSYDKDLLKYNGSTSPDGHQLVVIKPPLPEDPTLPLQ